MEATIQQLISTAGSILREITFHSDGRIIARTGGKAPHPKKLYSGKTIEEALTKLINDNPRPAELTLKKPSHK